MQPIHHPEKEIVVVPQRTSSVTAKTSFPLHWYIFFGILEPISVLAGVIYAIYFQENYYHELIPIGYLDKIASSTLSSAARKSVRSFWKVATQESTGFNADSKVALASLTEPTQMALAQLGSCEAAKIGYFLIFLNSAIMLFFIRKHFAHSPVSQERVLYAFFFVLGAADWTHILLTIHYLPSPSGTLSANHFTQFASKLIVLTDYTTWNSLLFGNIFITLILFTFRAAWWVGIGRDTFAPGTGVSIDSNLKSQ